MLTELKPLSTFNFNATLPADINDLGHVVGTSFWYSTPFNPVTASGPSSMATLWKNGNPSALTTSANRSKAVRINSKGEVLYIEYGHPHDEINPTYFLWKDGVAVDLKTLVPGLTHALDLNDKSMILVRHSDDPSETGSLYDLGADTLVPLPPLVVDGQVKNSVKIGIDNLGRVVEMVVGMTSAGDSGAHMWDIYWLDAGGASWNYAGISTFPETRPCLSRSGWVLASVADGQGNAVACYLNLDEPSWLRYIPPLSPFRNWVVALDANAQGQIVGTANYDTPILYDAQSGKILEASLDPGWDGDYASGINAHGQVIGWGTKDYGTPAFQKRGWVLKWDEDKPFVQVAIDPLAVVLSDEVYVKINLPYPPPVDVLMDQIRKLVQTMGPEKTKHALARVRAFSAYARAAEQELSKHVN